MIPFPSASEGGVKFRSGLRVVSLASMVLFACEATTVEFTETKGIDERLSEEDLSAVLTVLKIAGERERPHLPKPFLPAPQWAEQRSLPVRELVAEEQDRYERAWSSAAAAGKLPKGEPWDSAVASRRLTRDQFCALLISIVAALGKSAINPELDLAELERRGARESAILAADERPFSSLTAEQKHAALRRAAWVAIASRALHLAQVPEPNSRLVSEHRERLAEVLPTEYFADPFVGLYPRPEDYGIPFEEGELSDADLTWSPEQAIFGTDRAETTVPASTERL